MFHTRTLQVQPGASRGAPQRREVRRVLVSCC